MFHQIVVICSLLLACSTCTLYEWLPLFYDNLINASKQVKANSWLHSQCSDPHAKQHLVHYTNACEHINQHVQENMWNIAWEQSKPKMPWVFIHFHVIMAILFFLLVLLLLSPFAIRRRYRSFSLL